VRLRIKLEGVSYDVEVEALPEPEPALDEENDFLGEVACPPPPSDTLPQDSICRSPINGAVVSVLVKPGDRVRKDDPVAIVEAMKMQISIGSPLDGTVEEIMIAVGDSVAPGQTICTLV